ncbi:MAG: dihydropteroate synthase [Pirellulaceae bacterium]|nr:dihydropteroate synthase [Pirellulaceae bacterium]
MINETVVRERYLRLGEKFPLRLSHWELRTSWLTFDRPCFMGILNVTPDSFSDGGQFFSPQKGVDHALQLIDDGALILDIGGQSTRPGAKEVSVSEELRRVLPILQKLKTITKIPLSIDTSKPEVAKEALEAGADIINDVTGFASEKMCQVVADYLPGVCVMHMQGAPETMQKAPTYNEVVSEIEMFLREQVDKLVRYGLEREQICIDVGLGFGKTLDHNLELITRLGEFHCTGQPLLVGHSRKSYLGKLLGTQDNPKAREMATLTATLAMLHQGVQIFRLHNVKAAKEGVDIYLTHLGDLASPNDP